MNNNIVTIDTRYVILWIITNIGRTYERILDANTYATRMVLESDKNVN